MYRAAAKRLLHRVVGATSPRNATSTATAAQPRLCIRFSTTPLDNNADKIPKPNHPYYVESIPSSSSSSSSSSGSKSSTAEEASRRHQRTRPLFDYQEHQARVLQASLAHVKSLGWSESAMIAGAKDMGVSPSIVGSFPRKGAALVEYFMDDCLQKLIDKIDSGEGLNELTPSERISKLIKMRLEMQAPYISKWPEALAIQAQPANVPTSFKQRAMLIDEICHAAGGDTSDIDWYAKRTVLGAVYSTTEVYMLTDSSPGFQDTWVFLDNRVQDAFNLKKSFQEATYLADAVSAGIGNSLQGFVRKVTRA